MADAKAAADVARGDDLLEQVRALRSKAINLLMAAERAGDLRTALRGVAEARACVELLARLEGELDERAQVNVLVAPEWLAIRAAVVGALRPFPEAGEAVANALTRLEAGHG